MINRLILFCIVIQGLLISPVLAGEVTFSGDSRVRFIYRDNILFGNQSESAQDPIDSRVRIRAHAQADGGAYAVGRFRVDDKWGYDYDDGTGVKTYSDLAYLGVPIGPTVLEAGYMRSDVTRFFEWDQTVDQFIVAWDMFSVNWKASYRVLDEGQESAFEIDRLEDNDEVVYGLVGAKDFTDHLFAQANLFYADDQRDEYVTGQYVDSASGFYWSLFLGSKYPDFAFETEVAFKAGNVRQSRDETGAVINTENVGRGDGWGWYSEGKYSFDSAVLTLNLGFTIDGYEADNDFGWIMLGNGNNEPISVIPQLGENGDWFWIAPSLLYRFNEQLNVVGHFVWASIDAYKSDDDTLLQYKSLMEVSGDLTYEIGSGATLSWKLGWLIPEIDGIYQGNEVTEDTAFATYLRLQIKF